jgi:hypothetical protein
MEEKLPKYQVIMWDWKEQPYVPEFTKAAQKGLIYFNDIDSDGDYYLVIAAQRKLTKEEIKAIRTEEGGF